MSKVRKRYCEVCLRGGTRLDLDVAGFTALSAQQLLPSQITWQVLVGFNRLRSHEYICSSHLVRGTSQYNVPGAIHECRTWSMIGAFDESRVTEIRIAMLLWVEDAAE
jgi:hypothetical protein